MRPDTQIAMLQSDPLRQCIDAALSDSDELIRRVARQVVETFQTHAESALSSRDRQHYDDLLVVLRQAEGDLVRAFVGQFSTLLQQEIQGKPAVPAKPVELRLDQLSLVDDASVQEDVEVSQIIRMIESGAEWEIRDLNARMESLRQSDGQRRGGESQMNPLRPEVFGRSLQRALGSLDVDHEARLALLRAFGVAMTSALKETYSTYNGRLEAAHVTPARYSVRTSGVRSPVRPQSAQSAGQGGGQETAQVGAAGADAMTAVGADGILQLRDLQRLLQGYDAPSSVQGRQSLQAAASPDDAAGGPQSTFGQAMQTAMLRSALDRLTQANRLGVGEGFTQWSGPGAVGGRPVNIIEHYRDELQSATTRPLERLTIDVVSLMFDHILADPRLLPRVRAALGRLQIPILRLALNDAGVFSSRHHPTRRLINRIASFSAGYVNADEVAASGFLDWLDGMVESIVNAESEGEEVYAQQLERLEAWIARRAAETRESERDAVEALRRAEFRTVLGSALGRHVSSLLAHLDIDTYLKDFMRGPWTAVLVESVLRHGEDAEPTRNFKQAGSELLWSVQAKMGENQRKDLLQRLPGLVRQLEEGLTLINWSQDHRAAFFSALMRTHARAIRGEGMASSGQAADAYLLQSEWDRLLHLPQGQAVLGALEEVQLPEIDRQRAGLIDDLDLQLDLSTPSSRPDAALGCDISPTLQAIDNPGAFIDSLEEGHWVHWHLQGQWTRAQLAWRSPQGLFFMFTSRVGGHAHSLTRRAFERLLKSGHILPLEDKNLMDRAVEGVFSGLRQRAREAA
ncbi:MAG: DUF1631 family protein [Thiomonas sp.]